jgi:hypothetical protein
MVAFACAIEACGGKVVVDLEQASGGVGGASSSTSTSTSTTTSSTSSGPHGDLQITISEPPVVGMNCMPAVLPDPVSASIVILYDNSAGATAAEAQVTGGRVLFEKDADSLVWGFAVAPQGSGLLQPGQSVELEHEKVDGSGSAQKGSGSPCNFCNGSAQLEVDLTSQSLGAFTIGMDASIGCVQ